MKALKIIFIVVFGFGILFSNSSFSQAVVISNVDVDVHLTKKIRDADGKVIGTKTIYSLTSGIEKVVITPVGNLLRIVTFKIDNENPIMELANPVAFLRITMRADIDGDGNIDVLKDNKAVLTKSGNLKLMYHLNGAGSSLPNG